MPEHAALLQQRRDEVAAVCRGVWIFRGQDIPPIMKDECVDLELYNWSKVDLSDPVRPSSFSMAIMCGTAAACLGMSGLHHNRAASLPCPAYVPAIADACTSAGTEEAS